ncbi:uncharacterized protein LOC142235983 [Haematobia irritans]|uniref:uncharacterized protein LOC142235983 n=1 Tax=Haematobia irritans TaxID=7368 RepID=UPI003F500D3A
MEDLLRETGGDPTIILGDSNIDFLEYSASRDILNLLHSYGYDNCHYLVTRPMSRTCIDNVYSNIMDNLSINTIETSLTDHHVISCLFRAQKCSRGFYESKKLIVNYDLARDYLCTYLGSFHETGVPSEDTDKLIGYIACASEDASTTRTERRSMRSDLTPWVNKNLEALMSYKEKLLRRRKKEKGMDVSKRLKRISCIIRRAFRESMNDYYYCNLDRMKEEPKKCWKFLNESLGRKKRSEIYLRDDSGEIVEDNNVKCDLFNRFSYTDAEEVEEEISKLNLSKCSGWDGISPRMLYEYTATYPSALKMAKIIPVSKVNTASNLSEYRPIALLPIIDKVYERILHRQLSRYFEENNLLSPFQFGFRKGSGTEEAVVNVVNNICKGLDEGASGVAGIFYDLSKAFDLVDHGILIQKLRYYGLEEAALDLIGDYLRRKPDGLVSSQTAQFGMTSQRKKPNSVTARYVVSELLD